MVFKNHGPGGCCCVTSCPSWTDNWIGTNWYDNDDGVRAWQSFFTGTLSLGTNQLLANGIGDVSLDKSYLGGPSWGTFDGSRGSFSAVVDSDFVFFGFTDATTFSTAVGILFDRAGGKAYPAKAASSQSCYITGPGETFTSSSTFDVTWGMAIDGSNKDIWTLEIDAIDSSSNSIHHLMPVLNLTSFSITAKPVFVSPGNVYKGMGDYVNSRIVGTGFAGFKEVHTIQADGGVSYLSKTPQWKVDPFTVEGYGNRYRDDWNIVPERRTPILGSTFGDCPTLPDSWLGKYSWAYPDKYFKVGSGAMNVTSSGDLSRTDNVLSYSIANSPIDGMWRVWEKTLSTQVWVPTSGGPLISGTWSSRMVAWSGQAITFMDTYKFNASQEIIYVIHNFSAGNQNVAAEKDLPFNFTSTTPFGAFAARYDSRTTGAAPTLLASDVAAWRGNGMLWQVAASSPAP